jgi:hypothetical protein
MPNTVRLHRVLATKPDKVYRAFVVADAMAKWLPPYCPPNEWLFPVEKLRKDIRKLPPTFASAITPRR